MMGPIELLKKELNTMKVFVSMTGHRRKKMYMGLIPAYEKAIEILLRELHQTAT